MRRAHPIGFWLGLSAAACAPAPAPRAPTATGNPPSTAATPSSSAPDGGTITAPSEVLYPSVEPLPPVSVVLQYIDPTHRVPASSSPDVGPLPETALTAELSPLALPAMHSIGAIGGSGPRDVWLVDEDRRVYWYDGARLRARGQLCPEDALYGPMGGGMSLAVRAREIVVKGLLFTGTTPDPVVAVVPRPLPRSCDFRYASTFAAATGDDAVWTFDGERLRGRGGAPLPTPQVGEVEESPRQTALWLGSARHAWLARGACPSRGSGCHSAVWEYRGVSFIPRAPVDLAPVELWVDDRERVWLLGRDSDHAGRFSVAVLADGEWTRVATLASFGEARMVGRSATEVWFFDDAHLFVSDGAVAREVSTPLDRIESLWVEPGGPLWIGGSERDGDEAHGAVYRLAGVPR